MITRESLKDKEMATIQQEMEADVVTFVAEIADKTEEELKSLEDEMTPVFEANDEYLKGVLYEMAAETVLDDATIKRSEIIANIVSFLNRIEVEFRATLGIYQAIRFWKTKGVTENIPYPVFDNTLRLLGTLKFRGEKDMADILAVNNWFSSAHDQYLRDQLYTQYLATRHNEILNKLQALKPEPEYPVEDSTEA